MWIKGSYETREKKCEIGIDGRMNNMVLFQLPLEWRSRIDQLLLLLPLHPQLCHSRVLLLLHPMVRHLIPFLYNGHSINFSFSVRPPIPGVSPFNASGITVAHPSMTTITRETPKSGGTLFSMKKKNDKKKKIRKEDISNPTNFQSVTI